MTLVFRPPNADNASPSEFAPALISSRFGDGYSQDVNIGINGAMKKFNPKWTNAKKAEADYIISFLDSHKGSVAFFYVPNGETTLRAFKCKNYTAAWKRGGFCDISATFEPAAPNS